MPKSTQNAAVIPGSARAVLAENIVRIRRQLNWSQEMLALEASLHRTFIAHVERQSRNISIDNLEKIATALGVAPYLLLTPSRAESDVIVVSNSD